MALHEGKALASLMVLRAVEFCQCVRSTRKCQERPWKAQRMAALVIPGRKKEVRLEGINAHTHKRDCRKIPQGCASQTESSFPCPRLRESCECKGGGMKNGNPEHLQSPSNCFHSSSKCLYFPKFSGLTNMALYCFRELPKMTFKPSESQAPVPSLSELRPGGCWTQVISETHLSSLAATSQPEMGM